MIRRFRGASHSPHSNSNSQRSRAPRAKSTLRFPRAPTLRAAPRPPRPRRGRPRRRSRAAPRGRPPAAAPAAPCGKSHVFRPNFERPAFWGCALEYLFRALGFAFSWTCSPLFLEPEARAMETCAGVDSKVAGTAHALYLLLPLSLNVHCGRPSYARAFVFLIPKIHVGHLTNGLPLGTKFKKGPLGRQNFVGMNSPPRNKNLVVLLVSTRYLKQRTKPPTKGYLMVSVSLSKKATKQKNTAAPSLAPGLSFTCHRWIQLFASSALGTGLA